MNCPNCKTGMVQAKATNFGDDYWYCRPCKKELAEIVVLEEHTTAAVTLDKIENSPFKFLKWPVLPKATHRWSTNPTLLIHCEVCAVYKSINDVQPISCSAP